MNTSPSPRYMARRLALILAIACSSAAALIFEIALTRIFAVTQFYHFAFMAVSLALLGYGASGSILTVFPALAQPRRWAIFAFAQALATLGAYLLSNALPFDSYSIAWDERQVAYLALSYFALIAPFFCAGLVTGAVLARDSAERAPMPALDGMSHGEAALGAAPALARRRDASPRIPSHHAYAANLIGSGAGCLLALAGLSLVGRRRGDRLCGARGHAVCPGISTRVRSEIDRLYGDHPRRDRAVHLLGLSTARVGLSCASRPTKTSARRCVIRARRSFRPGGMPPRVSIMCRARAFVHYLD